MRRISLGLVGALLLLTVGVGHAQKPAAPPRPATVVANLVNLNTATAVQLETLPGVGARTAQRIIEHRQKNGNFKKIEELMNVRGIGEKGFLKLKPLITVGPAPQTPPQAIRR